MRVLQQYYYHSGPLGSAGIISDYKCYEYRMQYAPYGEMWMEKTNNAVNEYLRYQFTGKEQDEEDMALY